MSTRSAGEFFDDYAHEFDAIYGGRRGPVGRVLDRIFRRSMVLRFRRAVDGCRPAEGKAVLDVGCGPGHYGVALARETRADEPLAIDLAVRAWAEGCRGDRLQAYRSGRRAVELAERAGTPFFRTNAFMFFGQGLAELGEWDEANSVLEQAIAQARKAELRFLEGGILSYLSRAQLACGKTAEALVTAESAVSIAREFGADLFEAQAQLALAQVLLRLPPLREEDIEAALSAAAELIRATGAALLAPSLHEERARLARHRDDHAGYTDHLREAQRLYAEMGANGHAERLGRELGL